MSQLTFMSIFETPITTLIIQAFELSFKVFRPSLTFQTLPY
jgi:hypothetical protein